MNGQEINKEEVVKILNHLIGRGELIIFDPELRVMLSDEDIEVASLNGDAVQISLADDIPERFPAWSRTRPSDE